MRLRRLKSTVRLFLVFALAWTAPGLDFYRAFAGQFSKPSPRVQPSIPAASSPLQTHFPHSVPNPILEQIRIHNSVKALPYEPKLLLPYLPGPKTQPVSAGQEDESRKNPESIHFQNQKSWEEARTGLELMALDKIGEILLSQDPHSANSLGSGFSVLADALTSHPEELIEIYRTLFKNKNLHKEAAAQHLGILARTVGPAFLDETIPLFSEALRNEDEKVKKAAAKNLDDLIRTAGPEGLEKVLPLFWAALEDKETQEAAGSHMEIVFHRAGPLRGPVLKRLTELSEKHPELKVPLARTFLRFERDAVVQNDENVSKKMEQWLKDDDLRAASYASVFKSVKEKIPPREASDSKAPLPGRRPSPLAFLESLAHRLFSLNILAPDLRKSHLSLGDIADRLAQKEPLKREEAQNGLEDLDFLVSYHLKQSRNPSVKKEAVSAFLDFTALLDVGALKILTENLPSVPGKFYLWAVLSHLNLHKRSPDEIEALLPKWKSLQEEVKKLLKPQEAEAFLLQNQRRIARIHLVHPGLANEAVLKILRDSGLQQASLWLETMDHLSDRSIQWARSALSLIRPGPAQFQEMLSLLSSFSKDLSGLLDEKLALIFSETKAAPPPRLSDGDLPSPEGAAGAEDLIRELKKTVLRSLLKALGIPEAPSGENGLGWDWSLLPALTHLPKNFSATEEDPYLYNFKGLHYPGVLNLILKMQIQERSFLSALEEGPRGAYLKGEKKILKKIRSHNLKIKSLFEAGGLDYRTWTSWDGEGSVEIKKSRQAYVQDLKKRIVEILGDFKNRSPGLLSPERSRIVFNSVIKKWGLDQNLEEGLLRLAVRGKLDSFLEDLSRETRLSLPSRKLRLQVRLWERLPGHDLFQGNHTNCCIRLGGPHKKDGVIENYLLDAGMNILEVVHPETGRPVAQTFAYPVLHPDGTISLVLDNVEILPQYIPEGKQIRDALFEHSKSYARAFGKGKIKNIYLGVQANEQEGIPGDDVPTKDLEKKEVQMAKLGGPLGEKTYLDAFYTSKDRWHDGKMKKVPLFVVYSDEKLPENPGENQAQPEANVSPPQEDGSAPEAGGPQSQQAPPQELARGNWHMAKESFALGVLGVLGKLLSHPSHWSRRMLAAHLPELSEMLASSPIDLLAIHKTALEDKDPEVREAAAEELKTLAQKIEKPQLPELLSLFLKALEDPKTEVRLAAAYSLESLFKRFGASELDLLLPLFWKGLKYDYNDEHLKAVEIVADRLPVLLYFAGERRAEILLKVLELSKDFHAGRIVERELARALFYFWKDGHLQKDPRLLKKSLKQLKDSDAAVRFYSRALQRLRENGELTEEPEAFFKSIQTPEKTVSYGPLSRLEELAESLHSLVLSNPQLKEPSRKILGTAKKLVLKEEVSPVEVRSSLEDLTRWTDLLAAYSKTGIHERPASKAVVLLMTFMDPEFFKIFAGVLDLGLSGRLYGWTVLSELQLFNPHLPEALFLGLHRFFIPSFKALETELTGLLGKDQAEKFLLTHQRGIAKAHLLNPWTANRAILERIKTLGPAAASSWLKNAGLISSTALAWAGTAASRTLDPAQFEKMLSLLAVFSEHVSRHPEKIDMGGKTVFVPDSLHISEKKLAGTRSEKLAPEELISVLSDAFGAEILKALKIPESRLPALASGLEKWPVEFLPALTRIPQDPYVFFAWEMRNTEHRHFLSLILKMSLLEPDFLKAVTEGTRGSHYSELEKKLIRKIVRHNRKIKSLFEKSGLDYGAWIRWAKETPFDLTPKGSPSRRLQVRLWRRDPSRDLFQGNHTGSPFQLGEEDDQYHGIMEHYLLDTGMNLIEVLDEQTGRPVAQVPVYLGKSTFGSHETGLRLILDSIHVRPDFLAHEKEIKKAVFEYAWSFSSAFGKGKVEVLSGYRQDFQEKKGDVFSGDRKVENDISKFTSPLGELSYLSTFGGWDEGKKKKIDVYYPPFE